MLSLGELPDEILDIILSYYTKQLSGMIRFSTINCHCKEYVDHTVIWLTIDLFFLARREYLLTFFSPYHHDSFSQRKDHLLQVQAAAVPIYPLYFEQYVYSVPMFHPEQIYPFAYQVKVIRPPLPIDLEDIDSDLRDADTQNHMEDLRSSLAGQRSDSSERRERGRRRRYAKQIRDWYLPFYIRYQKIWHQHATVRPWILLIQCNLQHWLDQYLWNGTLLFGIICLVLAAYYFRDVDAIHRPQTLISTVLKHSSVDGSLVGREVLEQNVSFETFAVTPNFAPASAPVWAALNTNPNYRHGFKSLYGYLITFLLLHFLTMLLDFCSSFLSMRKTLQAIPFFFDFFCCQLQPFYFFILIVLTIMFSMQLIQWKSQYETEIPMIWTITTLPLGIFFLGMIRAHWKLFLSSSQNTFSARSPSIHTAMNQTPVIHVTNMVHPSFPPLFTGFTSTSSSMITMIPSWGSHNDLNFVDPAAMALNPTTSILNPTAAAPTHQQLQHYHNTPMNRHTSYLNGIDYILLTFCCLFTFYSILSDITREEHAVMISSRNNKFNSAQLISDLVVAQDFHQLLVSMCLFPFVMIILLLTMWKFYQSIVFWNQFCFGNDDCVYWMNCQKKKLTQLIANLGGLLASWCMLYLMGVWLYMNFYHQSSSTKEFVRILGDESLSVSSLSIGLLFIGSIQSFIMFSSLEGN